MGVKIMDGRIKKPYCGKNRNRKGNKKSCFFDSEVKKSDREPLNPNKPVRFKKTKYKARQDEIRSLGACQVCDTSYELDAPHHVVQGLGFKDDRYMINICVTCHSLIHSVAGYVGVAKTKEECKVIAWNNHLILEREGD